MKKPLRGAKGIGIAEFGFHMRPPIRPVNQPKAKQIVTADIYDLHHEHVQVCELQFCSFGRTESFYGQCSTLKTFEDHTPVLNVVKQKVKSRVLVVDGGASLRVGIMGDKLAAIAAKNGWIGVVLVGAIRDSLGINALDIGVKALGTTARRSWNPGRGQHNVPLQFGGISIDPGNWIYADRDCVLVSKKKLRVRAPKRS